jgi:hypothetical protein
MWSIPRNFAYCRLLPLIHWFYPFRVTQKSGFFEPLISSATVLPFPLKAAFQCACVLLRFSDFSVFPT